MQGQAAGGDVGCGVFCSFCLLDSKLISYDVEVSGDPLYCRVISWLLLSKYSLITLVSADPDFSDLHYNWLSVQSSTFDLV